MTLSSPFGIDASAGTVFICASIFSGIVMIYRSGCAFLLASSQAASPFGFDSVGSIYYQIVCTVAGVIYFFALSAFLFCSLCRYL
jgi:hypothetical protein